MNRSLLSLASLAVLSFIAGCGGSPDDRGSASTSGAPSTTPRTATTADWSCVGAGNGNQTSSLTFSSLAGTPPAGPITVHLSEAYSHNAVARAAIAVCAMFDDGCSSPLSQARSDDDGAASVTVTSGFDGYLQITGDGMPTNLFYVAGRTLSATGLDVTVYTGMATSMTTHLATPPPDAGGGIVALEVVDCTGAPAPGVKFDVGSEGTGMAQAYFVGDGAALSSAAHATDASGLAFVFDVPDGWVGVVGFRTPELTAVGGAIGSARTGAVTSILVTPNR